MTDEGDLLQPQRFDEANHVVYTTKAVYEFLICGIIGPAALQLIYRDNPELIG
ncbi:hypothetical protein MesoLj131a_62510 [Mesorhizobium sp. 131-2-1]|nr:hypothetical protein MesoLj131a_62510 [Mesorhizobium sp. 131-2-1]BCH04458.1 hypothetical protein MesoLj131b_64570 [Mesorhizobium sp. 131-2-5]